MVGWLRETSVDTPVGEMRARFDEDGYVFIKGLIPREDVLDMREKYGTLQTSHRVVDLY